LFDTTELLFNRGCDFHLIYSHQQLMIDKNGLEIIDYLLYYNSEHLSVTLTGHCLSGTYG